MKTARRGFAFSIQTSRWVMRSRTSTQGKTGPSLQTKFGPYWQCPQKPMPHFMFRSRETQTFGRDAAPLELQDGEADHHLGAADHRDGVVRVEGTRGMSVVTTPTLPRQSPWRGRPTRGPRDRGRPPLLQLLAVEDVLRRSARRRGGRRARSGRGWRGPGRGPAGAGRGRCPPPRRRRRSLRPPRRASSSRTGRGRRWSRLSSSVPIPFVTAPTARVVWTSRLRDPRVAADGDRDLADAEDVEHVELAGGEREPAAALGRSSSVKVSLVSFDPLHDARARNIGIREDSARRRGRGGRSGSHRRCRPVGMSS